ncbi:MAG: nucleotidyltransferase domain-containing protein [Sphingobacteriales bacterium]|nr:MAG: nucleotidyltransferase domain-containing protein [Sphingobacteriales bacterium]
MIAEIDYHTDEFAALCKSHKVNELYLFGSFANGNSSKDSDVDLIVDIQEKDPIQKGQLLLSLYSNFESYFKRRIDLLTFESIRNPFLEEQIELTKKLIYSGPKEEVN